MELNNFNIILPYIIGKDREFYYIQIKSEHKDAINDRVINSYYIKSAKELELVKEEIIMLCKLYKAKAYISIQRRKVKYLYTNLYKYLYQQIKTKSFSFNPLQLIHNTVKKSICNQWLISLYDNSYKDDILTYLDSKIIIVIPILNNGIQIVTKDFDNTEFKKLFSTISIHRTSVGVLLYYDNN